MSDRKRIENVRVQVDQDLVGTATMYENGEMTITIRPGWRGQQLFELAEHGYRVELELGWSLAPVVPRELS